jgi:hypothetical protein
MPQGPSLAVALADQIERQTAEDDFPARRSRIVDARRMLLVGADIGIGAAARFSHIAGVLKDLKDRLPTQGPGGFQGDPDRLFVRDALRHRKVALHVDHAEGCSPEDWTFLSALLLSTDVLLLIEGYEGYEVDARISSVMVRTLRLERLEESFAAILFDSVPAGLGSMLGEDFRLTGNLKPFGRLASQRQRLVPPAGGTGGLSETLLGFSRSALKSLADLDRQALVAISAHAGAAVGLGLLRRFLGEMAPEGARTTDVLALVRRLEDKALVVQTSEGLQAPGFVFALIAEDARLALARLVFQQRWRDYYLDPQRCGLPLTDQRRCLQALRQCVVLKDGVGVAATLEAVNVVHADAGTRADSAGFTRWLVSQFDLEAEPAVAVAAARHLYCAGWYVHARDVLLAAGEPRGRRHRYLLAELLCAAGPQDRGLGRAFHERELISGTDDPDAELCIELIIMHGLRNSNRFAEARARFRTAIIQQRFRSRPAFTVLLRFADSCLMLDEDLEACCRTLQDAADLAVDRLQIEEAVSAYVSLSQQHGYHDLDFAERCLAQAEVLSEGAWVQLPAILNNKAVLALYRGKVDAAGLMLLEDALLLSSEPLDEILIRTNILVHRAMSGDVSGAGAAELVACLADEGLDTEIRKIAHYNLEVLAKARKDESEAAHHGAIWRSLDSGIDRAFWTARRSGGRTSDVPPWRLDLVHYPVLLSHWKLGTVPFDAIAD